MINKNSERVAIDCRGLNRSFGDVPAVHHVDLQVLEGQFVALLGPSGCGKTTVLRLIAGLDQPDGGTIDVAGSRVFESGKSVSPDKRSVGMVFQEYALFPHLTVSSNVGYGLSCCSSTRDCSDCRKRVDDVLSMVGLEDVKNRMPHELSGGQQQRVALARAMAPSPSVILLDEPFSNLDAVLRNRVRSEVRRILRQAEITAVFVTHDQEEALSLADKLAVMIDGEIVQSDTPERLYHNPKTHQVATFLGDANFVAGTAKGGLVECELGALPTKNEAVGQVELMFRPEELLLKKSDNGLGQIVDLEYFGHDQLVHIELKTGTRLRSRLVGSNVSFSLGQRVSLSIDRPVTAYPS